MKHADFLIVGGSAAGTTAAEVIRSLEADSSIIVVTDEPHEEYSRVLLPQYVTHKVERENI
ncbi:MAG: FAD/NAD(P)-binding oxidoreductase, partial [Candidatus Curtissbacteria bacterium]|nr:FAD/NAD(P)-binding oxidoreductase [Candidatus Curtissbacteria bacterium]